MCVCCPVLWLHKLVLPGALVWKCGADPAGLCQSRTHLLQTQTHSGEAERVAWDLWHTGWVTATALHCATERHAVNHNKRLCMISLSPDPGNPRPLKHLCRLVMRRQMTPKRLSDPDIMDSAPFAPRVKSYLVYKEFDIYGKGMDLNMWIYVQYIGQDLLTSTVQETLECSAMDFRVGLCHIKHLSYDKLLCCSSS